MRFCRGVSAVVLSLAALAFIVSLGLPAAGQPATTSSTIDPTRTTVGPTGTAPGGSQTTVLPSGGGEIGAPGRGAVLILVRRLTWRQAAAAVRGRSETIAAGLISTQPGDASLATRVLSLASGRQIDAAALAGGTDPAAIERMRAANPDARLGGLPQVRVVAASGLEAAALIGLGPTGEPPPVAPLEVTGLPAPASGELLVVAVPDAAALERVLGQLRQGSQAPDNSGGAPTTGGVPTTGAVPDADATPAPSRFVIVGLEPAEGRAHTAPFIALGGSPGLVTSDSTRRRGLIAFQDVRPTLAGSAAGTDGSPIHVLAVVDPLGTVGRLDRLVAALVAARVWAILLAAVVGSAALAASLLALLLRRRSGRARGREVFRRVARALLLVALALPSGYLVASMVAPLSWSLWLGLGAGAGVALALAAWLVDRLSVRQWRRPGRSRQAKQAPETKEAPPSAAKEAPVPVTAPVAKEAAAEVTPWAAPAVLGALLTGLIVADLLLGGLALSRPLLGNSAFDGERFYGLGNGYFAHALAGVFLVVAFRRPSPGAAAALLIGLALADGLPVLGADVGGALTAVLTAAAAWLLLRRRRWGRVRVLLVVAGAVVLAVAIAFGVGLATGQVSHGSRIAREFLGSDPSAALRAVRQQLSGNFGLLAENFWAWWGPALVIFAAVASVRPPSLLAGVPAQVRRTVGVGAIGSLLLILLNDTGVTAAAGSGFVLAAILAWCALERPEEQRPVSAVPAAAEPATAIQTAAPVGAEPAGELVSPKPADPDGTWKPASAPPSGEPAPAPGKPDPDAEPAPARASAEGAGRDDRRDPEVHHNWGGGIRSPWGRGARRGGSGT